MMRPGLGLDLGELCELTFKLAFHSQGGIGASYVDTLPVREVLLYLKSLVRQQEREEKYLRTIMRRREV